MGNDELRKFEPLHGRDDIKDAFDNMCAVLSSHQIQKRSVSTPAGVTELDTYWHELDNFRAWCGFRDPDVRERRNYWNCFGIDNSIGENSTLSPDLEINPPPAGGLNLNYGGGFLTTGSGGDIYVGHTGRITIHHRKERLTRERFIAEYEARPSHLPIIEVFRKSQQDYVTVILIGRIAEATFKNKLFGFVRDVKTIKNQFRNKKAPDSFGSDPNGINHKLGS